MLWCPLSPQVILLNRYHLLPPAMWDKYFAELMKRFKSLLKENKEVIWKLPKTSFNQLGSISLYTIEKVNCPNEY